MDSTEVYSQLFEEPLALTAKFLQTSLKGKKLLPDDITNTYVELLPRYHAVSPTGLLSYLTALLGELTLIEAPGIIAKSLIGAVRHFMKKEESAQWFPADAIAAFFGEQWKKLSPMYLSALASLFEESLLPAKEELVAHAVQLWRRDRRREAVYFAVDFNLKRELVAAFESADSEGKDNRVLPKLVANDHIDLLLHITQGDIVLVQQAIPLLNSNKHVKVAGRLIEEHGLDPWAFPEIITRMKKIAVRYLTNAKDQEISLVIERLADDDECMKILLEDLEFKYSSKKLTYAGVLAAKILRDYPHVAATLRPDVLATLQRITPGDGPLASADSFGPRDSNALRLPLDISAVQFLSSEESLSRADFTSSDVLGLDCEWRPSMIKFQQYPVALLQMSTRTVVYIVDLISLWNSALLDEKLSAAFQDPGVVKLGLNFSDDRKMLIKNYPQVAAFRQPMVSYADLQNSYKELFPEEEGSGGLANLCQRFLGTKLCKAEQMSNWERRPLRLAQLHYAALDAHVEVLIWDRLTHEAKERGDDPLDGVYALGDPDEELRASSHASSQTKCRNCTEVGHKQKNCPKGPKCFVCQQFGHISSSCPKAS